MCVWGGGVLAPTPPNSAPLKVVSSLNFNSSLTFNSSCRTWVVVSLFWLFTFLFAPLELGYPSPKQNHTCLNMLPTHRSVNMFQDLVQYPFFYEHHSLPILSEVPFGDCLVSRQGNVLFCLAQSSTPKECQYFWHILSHHHVYKIPMFCSCFIKCFIFLGLVSSGANFQGLLCLPNSPTHTVCQHVC